MANTYRRDPREGHVFGMKDRRIPKRALQWEVLYFKTGGTMEAKRKLEKSGRRRLSKGETHPGKS